MAWKLSTIPKNWEYSPEWYQKVGIVISKPSILEIVIVLDTKSQLAKSADYQASYFVNINKV